MLELEICEAFDWNVRKITFYDYVEHFMSIGVLLEVDKIPSNNKLFGGLERR